MGDFKLTRREDAMVCTLSLAREALELLREREWSVVEPATSDHGAVRECLSCAAREWRADDHAPTCRLARVLRELEEATR